MPPSGIRQGDNLASKKPRLVKTQSGAIDHLAISESLGYQIFRKQKRKAWTTSEDETLKKLVIETYLTKTKTGEYNNQRIDIDLINWEQIATKLPLRKPKDCRKRWSSSLDPCLRKGKWTKEEDDLLVKAYQTYGPAWQKVASEIEGRTEDQCSKRYIEVLNPDTKDRLKPWTLEEDLQLISGVKKYGTKWRTIASAIKGRPSLTCRNRWRKIMTDVAKNNAGEEIMKAVGVLGPNGQPIDATKRSNLKEVSTPADSQADSAEQTSKQKESNNNSNINNKRNNHLSLKDNLDSISSDHSLNTSNSTRSEKSSFQRQSLGANINSSMVNEHNFKSTSPPVSKSTSTFFNRSNYASPGRSQTEWKFGILDPSTNETIPEFHGPIDSQELAQRLIDLAKYNGVAITVHQHIHHHYTPQLPITDPETSINRYSHFNYLPPLTEVPKLTSSSSTENTIDSKNNGENNIMHLLNNDGKSPAGKIRSPVGNFIGTPTSEPQSTSASTTKMGSSSSMKTGSSNMIGGTINNGVQSEPLTEDLDEEQDFWESMRNLTQPRGISQGNKPVSQHHPLHYQSSTFVGGFPLNTASEQAKPSRISNQPNTVPKPGTLMNIGSMYMTDPPDEEEELEGYANQYGIYYNVLTNTSNTRLSPGSNVKEKGSDSTKKPSSETASSSSGSFNGNGYALPFNPS